MILYNFGNAWSGTFPRLSARVLPAKLRNAECASDFILHTLREGSKSSKLEAIQNSGFSPRARFFLLIYYPNIGILSQIDFRSGLSAHCSYQRFTDAAGVGRMPIAGPAVPASLSMTDCSGSIQKAQMAAPMKSSPADTETGATHEPRDTR